MSRAVNWSAVGRSDMKLFLILSAVLSVSLAAENFQCPVDESTGKFADPDDCDKYWDCFRGSPEAKYCPDGLAYDPSRASLPEPCDYLFKVDCSNRPGIGEPLGSGNCERHNGVYPHEDPNVCDKYYVCMNNQGLLNECPPGLHFSLENKACDWPTSANRGSCDYKQKLDNFECDPAQEYFTADGQKIVHPRFLHEDCSKFYVCKNGITPSVAGCDNDLVFNDVTKECDDIANVPECDPNFEDKSPNAGGVATTKRRRK